MKYALVAVMTALLVGCSGQLAEVLPTASDDDCYHAERTVNASPVMGASAVLDGKLVKRGCVELIKAITEAKKEGVEIDAGQLLGL